MNPDRKKTWLHQHVVDAALPDFVIRTYLEQLDLRSWLHRISCELKIQRACDIGAGYGRLTPVLTEFACEIIAFEREPHFINDIQRLLPQVEACRIERLSQLPVAANSFQFVLSFTVLQHLQDEEVISVIDEIKRITAQPSTTVVDT